MFSGVSLASACMIARIPFCMEAEGAALSKMEGGAASSVSPPGRSEVRTVLAGGEVRLGVGDVAGVGYVRSASL